MKPEFHLPKEIFYTSRDGLRLCVKDYQPHATTTRLPLICLPGLSRNSSDFSLLAQNILGDDRAARRVVAFDYRGRGQSEYDSDWRNYNIVTEAEDVLSGLTALGIEHGIFLGTSRGGLITMALSGARPNAIKAAIFNDIGPVIDGAGLMQIRAYLSRTTRPKSWAEAIEIRKALMAKNFPTWSEDDWAFEARCRYDEDKDGLRQNFDPKLAKTMAKLDAGARLPTVWPQFIGLKNVPLMVIRAENSNILSAKTVKQMAELHPNLQAAIAEGQGHAPALHIGGLPEKISSFCDQVDQA